MNRWLLVWHYIGSTWASITDQIDVILLIHNSNYKYPSHGELL